MRPEQWDIFKRAARLEKLDKIPMAMIVDSPWIPGYLGIKHFEFGHGTIRTLADGINVQPEKMSRIVELPATINS